MVGTKQGIDEWTDDGPIHKLDERIDKSIGWVRRPFN